MTYQESIVVFNADTVDGEAIVREMLESKQRQHVTQQFAHVYGTVRDIAHTGDLGALGTCLIELGENPDENRLAECLKEGNIKTAVLVPECGSKHMLQQAKKIINACKHSHIERFVLMSLIGAEDTSVETGKIFHEIENSVKQAGISCSGIVRTAPLQQGMLLFRQMMRKQKLCLPMKEDARFTLVNLCDVACFVVYELLHNRLQRGATGSEPQVFKLTGHAVHTIKDVIQTLERIVGTNLKYQHVDRNDFERYLHEEVMIPESLAKELADKFELINRGRLNFVSDDMKKSTGKEPIKFEEWLNKHKDLFHLQ